MKKRKHTVSQETKEYLSYLQKTRHMKIPKEDTVTYWYFRVLKKAGINPMDIKNNDPRYGENGSAIFPEDWE